MAVGIAAKGGTTIPADGFFEVFLTPPTLLIHEADVFHGKAVPLFRRQFEETESLLVVLFDAKTLLEEISQVT